MALADVKVVLLPVDQDRAGKAAVVPPDRVGKMASRVDVKGDKAALLPSLSIHSTGRTELLAERGRLGMLPTMT